MDLLLDTHTFIWFVEGDARLSPIARTLIENDNNVKLFSVVSVWEMAIKVSLKKLVLAMAQPFDSQVINSLLDQYGFVLHPVTLDHVARVADLPFPTDHRDPFDRLLIATAILDSMPIVSADAKFDDYAGVRRLF